MSHDLQEIEEHQLAGSAPLRRGRRRAAACTALVWVMNVEYKTPCAVCSLVAIHQHTVFGRVQHNPGDEGTLLHAPRTHPAGVQQLNLQAAHTLHRGLQPRSWPERSAHAHAQCKAAMHAAMHR
jgi:hypothetical protein